MIWSEMHLLHKTERDKFNNNKDEIQYAVKLHTIKSILNRNMSENRLISFYFNAKTFKLYRKPFSSQYFPEMKTIRLKKNNVF